MSRLNRHVASLLATLVDRLDQACQARMSKAFRVWPPLASSPLERLCGPMDQPLLDPLADG